MALLPGTIPYGATFLIFSEYMRPPIRLAAIMKIRPIYVFTHDSIGLGEDGTTHQPIEQLVSLRSIPNLTVIRPADANETAQAWRVAIEHKTGPVAIVLTRQNLPVIDQQQYTKATELEKGAYILSEAHAAPELILIATGSEVQLIMQAQAKLKDEGIAARVVSMPSWELFAKQDASYKEKVFPAKVRRRISVEAGSTLGWSKFVTEDGITMGIDTFGESAPAEILFKHFGLTVEEIVKKAKALK
jgi:transketolase